MNTFSYTLTALCLVAFVAGCTEKPVIYKSTGQQMARERESNIFSLTPLDTEMMIEAMDYLSNAEGKPNYNLARARLTALIADHPQSKWVESARNLIQTINNLLALQVMIKEEKQELEKAHTDKSKLVRENELIKRNYKALEEKHQAETIRLQQENEQLKNNIAHLKKLEIELEKREKLLK